MIFSYLVIGKQPIAYDTFVDLVPRYVVAISIPQFHKPRLQVCVSFAYDIDRLTQRSLKVETG